MRSSYRAEQALNRNNAGLVNRGSTPTSELAASGGADAHRVSAGADVLPRRRERAADIPAPLIRRLGRVEYEPTWRNMQRFTDERDATTPDEIWFLEHPPVFTLGMQRARRMCWPLARFRLSRSIAAVR